MNLHLLPKYRYDRKALAHLVERGLTDIEIAKMYGVAPATVANRRHRWKIQRPRKLPDQAFASVTPAYIRECVERGMTDKEIAKEAGCSHTMIEHRRRRAGIKSAYQLSLRDKPNTSSDRYSEPRQIAEWPNLPADAFKDVRTRHHGKRVSGGLAEARRVGEWTL